MGAIRVTRRNIASASVVQYDPTIKAYGLYLICMVRHHKTDLIAALLHPSYSIFIPLNSKCDDYNLQMGSSMRGSAGIYSGDVVWNFIQATLRA
ncbi:hypothetical protein QA601_15770 [Chitinispirillales bacterium ANBcel5]|uniref:hypothetical protein n=1 Tax=Cellulosispirillum alkaliphilum TaxID=3039283 RepID=UPI002A5301D9|nr:hypothetical protein [Chitinispirillales bacterium ANBcel5]